MRKLQKSKFAQSLILGLFWAYCTQIAVTTSPENRLEAHVRKSLLEGIQPCWFFFPQFLTVKGKVAEEVGCKASGHIIVAYLMNF